LIKSLEFGKFKPSRTNEAPKIGFVFTGQGAQWWAMGRELIEAYPVFKDCVIEAEGYLKEFGSKWSLIGKLFFSYI
jgi:acyl transferase domain-containing protein